ncbi:MAG: MBOAT family O-acyltransferase, partial [Bacteroidia bacterium]
MVFSSIIFLLYFLPLVLVVNYLVPNKYRNYWLLIASLFFYAWGAPKFLFVLMGSIFANFWLVKQMHLSLSKSLKKFLLSLSVLINVALLVYFKYFNFFIENINQLIQSAGGVSITWAKILLPIGISFFTFQSLTYTVDVFRKIHQPLKKWSDYALYIMLFPQMIAGPIVRFSTIANQIIERKTSTTAFKQGLVRFIIGLSKKVLIANTLAQHSSENLVLNNVELNTTNAWVGILAYSFQIYFDFSGYSDMAIGIGKMLGFNFPENFNNPYNSKSITEFWRRWHITLGTWMRDYLYIPLGGNRVKTKGRLYFNLFFVFLISGLWHGASWNFVIWGAYHGFFLVIERLFLSRLIQRLPSILALIYAFFVVVIGWVFFSIESFETAINYVKILFSFNFKIEDFIIDRKVLFTLVLALFFSTIGLFRVG